MRKGKVVQDDRKGKEDGTDGHLCKPGPIMVLRNDYKNQKAGKEQHKGDVIGKDNRSFFLNTVPSRYSTFSNFLK